MIYEKYVWIAIDDNGMTQEYRGSLDEVSFDIDFVPRIIMRCDF